MGADEDWDRLVREMREERERAKRELDEAWGKRREDEARDRSRARALVVGWVSVAMGLTGAAWMLWRLVVR